jgi:hypothetical protein
LDVDEDDVHLSFMLSKNGKAYKWPDTSDSSWEPIENVIETLGNPSLSNDSTNDRQFYIFK